MAEQRILVLGGAGFVGRHVVERLVDLGCDVVVPTRRQDKAQPLFVLPTVNVVSADVGAPGVLAGLAQGASAIVNLVGILNETGGQTFQKAHVDFTHGVIKACRAAGVRRLVHMSALNADPGGPSKYLRSKGDAEAAVSASGLDWTIFRPSVIFGREDAFLNLFARLLRVAPVMALAGAGARFQPVYVGDVAECFARALIKREETAGRTFPLCGPRIYTLRELVRFAGEVTGRPRPIIALGPALSTLEAVVLEHLPGTLMSRDNLASMQRDSVCDCAFPAEFGIVPQSLETIAPTYLGPEAAKGRYDRYRLRGGR
jgi:NADH dehydrogenase